MAGSAELRCGSADHRVVADAENGETDEYSQSYEDTTDDIFPYVTHGFSSFGMKII